MKKFLMLAGILASLGAPWASATVEVRLINGAADTGWLTNTAGGGCTSFTSSTCTFVGSVGNYSFALASGIQNTGFNPLLDLGYQVNSTTLANAGTLIIEVMASGYTTGTPGTLLHGSGNSTLGDQVTFADYGGNNNNVCPTASTTCAPNLASPNTGSTLLSSIGPLNDNAGFNSTLGGGGTSANPYSLGIILTLASPTSLGTASGDIMINAVPEPASVMLLGGVLLFTVGAVRRKMRPSA